MELLSKVSVAETGIEISRLGLGGFHQLEVSSEVVQQTVDTFLEAGGNYIETARGYGNGASEQKIAKAIRGRREALVLASKSHQRTAAGLKSDLEASLKTLGTDHINFYFFHNIETDKELDQIMASGGALDAMMKAKDAGLIDGIGMSSHRPWMYQHAIERGLPLSLILIWHNYLDTLHFPEIRHTVFPLARSRGITITAMKPLADGLLYRSVDNAIRYALGTGPDILVCGMNSPQQVREVAAAARQGPADETIIDRIMTESPELGQYVCRQCGDCPDKVMELFRLEGYVDRQMTDFYPHDPAEFSLRCRLGGWFGLADTGRERFADVGDINHLIHAANGIACPYGIDITRKIRIACAKLSDNRQEYL